MKVFTGITWTEAASDRFLKELVDAVITPHILIEIRDYFNLKNQSKNRYNATVIFIIITSSLLPFLIFVCGEKYKWIPILMSAIATMLTSVNYAYNLKYEWESHLIGYANQAGALKEWELGILSARFGKPEEERIAAYAALTEAFVKNFNAYEVAEIKGYFINIKEVKQEQQATADKVDKLS